MALSKIQAESLNLADTYAFTGTVSGAGAVLQQGMLKVVMRLSYLTQPM